MPVPLGVPACVRLAVADAVGPTVRLRVSVADGETAWVRLAVADGDDGDSVGVPRIPNNRVSSVNKRILIVGRDKTHN